ncbi:MAG: OmpA family protein [Gemmatimonadaceae bacterium]
MPTRVQRLFAVAVLVLAVVSACRRKPAETPVPVTNPVPGETCDQRCRDSVAAVERARRDSAERAAREAAARDSVRAIENLRSTLAEKVFFDYDQAVLTDESKATLDRKLPILRANAAMRLRVSGHADERGSDEYNIALGQRRAAAVKRYFADQGVDPMRVDIVSFGEEQPAVQGMSEEAFAQNRRAEFEVTAGGQSLVVPK